MPPIHPKNFESIPKQPVTMTGYNVNVHSSYVMEKPVTAVKRVIAPAFQAPVMKTALNKQQEKHCSPRKIETTIKYPRQRL
jgi:hypothetical protein